MATDKSEPRIGVIVKVAVLAIATLVVVHAALVAYFDAIAHAEEHRKFGEAKPEALLSLRESENQKLMSGPVPIERAMQDIAAHGRKANPELAPTASKDLAPLQGWAQMPAEVPREMTAVEPPAEAKSDAGVALAAADAGAVKAKNDGGAGPKAPARNPIKP